MSVILSNDLSVAMIDNNTISNEVKLQEDSVVEYRVAVDGGWYVDPMGGMEQENPSIFANPFFLIGLTIAVIAAGVGCGFLFAKSKIKKGLDYDENY